MYLSVESWGRVGYVSQQRRAADIHNLIQAREEQNRTLVPGFKFQLNNRKITRLSVSIPSYFRY
jgi:hypothetical protein